MELQTTHPGVAETLPPPSAEVAEEARARALVRGPRRLESLLLFALFAAAYAVLGIHVIGVNHVIVFDAMDHLSRAYMVWWNAPPKPRAPRLPPPAGDDAGVPPGGGAKAAGDLAGRARGDLGAARRRDHGRAQHRARPLRAAAAGSTAGAGPVRRQPAVGVLRLQRHEPG